jgi:hypothetical protein
MKKYHTYKNRKFSYRDTFKKIIIITEGKKTEKIYFENFKTRNNGLNIKIHPAGCTDVKHIVEYALNKTNHSKWAFDKEKDELWCVYDIDNNS